MREGEKGKAVILDQTIFYPQGGGQPTDTGYIRSGSGVFKVTFVMLDPDGVVWHFGEFETGAFTAGEEVALEIDRDKRKIHARIHSAGHLMDCAIEAMGINLNLNKGFHFVEGPYIEGDGTVEDTEKFKAELEQKLNELVASGLSMQKQVLTETEARERGITAPPGKDVRLLNFDGYKPCGCGGTHVTNSKDIGQIVIRKVSSKQGKTKIAYAVV